MKYVQHEGDHLKFIIVEPNGFDPERSYPLVILERSAMRSCVSQKTPSFART